VYRCRHVLQGIELGTYAIKQVAVGPHKDVVFFACDSHAKCRRCVSNCPVAAAERGREHVLSFSPLRAAAALQRQRRSARPCNWPNVNDLSPICGLGATGEDHPWLRHVLREVRVLEKLRHPNVIAYKHSWMEYLQVGDRIRGKASKAVKHKFPC